MKRLWQLMTTNIGLPMMLLMVIALVIAINGIKEYFQ
jgi:hypothetical protein